MNKKLKMLTSCAIIASSFALGAFANGFVESIQAEMHKDMTIIIDGQAQTFADANGATVYPLMYNGTTYLPVRAIGGLMGKNVAWDGSTKTITLTAPSYNLGGSLIYEDEFIEIRFKKAYAEDSWLGLTHGVKLTVVNKTKNTLNLYCDSFGANGISYGDFFVDGAVAPNSTGIVNCYSLDGDDEIFDTFVPAEFKKISGEFRYQPDPDKWEYQHVVFNDIVIE